MNKPQMILTDEEVKALYDYFLERAGYVSYEFDPLLRHLIIKLEEWILEKHD